MATGLIVLGAIVVFWLIFSYNRLVRKRNLVREGWSGIDVQLKRRYDLVPALVETVRGYRDHERGVLEKVTSARTRCRGDFPPAERGEAEAGLARAIKTLFAVVENYPELKAGANFLSLQEELAGIEEALQFARRYYNGAVREYNSFALSFPAVIPARLAGFGPEPYFQLDDPGERMAPTVGE